MGINDGSDFRSNGFGCTEIEELLDDFLEGDLGPKTEVAFSEHIDLCSQCNSLVEDCRRIIELARELNNMPIRPELQRRLREALRREVGFGGSVRKPNLHVVK